MLRRVLGVAAAIGLLAGVATAAAEPPPLQPSAPEGANLWTLIGPLAAAREAGEWQRVREGYEAALALAPSHPGVLGRLVQAEVNLGNIDGALERMEELAAAGGTMALEGELLAFVDDSERGRAVAAALAENAGPQSAGELVATFEDRELFPEGIALDSETGDLYVGSFHRGHLVRVTQDGRQEVVGDPSEQALRSVLGVWVDAPRRELWAVSANGPDAPGDAPSPEVVRLSLPSGRLVGRYPTPDDGAVRMLNDVTVAGDGTVWVSESLESGLWRLSPGGSRLELFRPSPDLGFANGVAVSADGRTVYLAHAEGLSAIDSTTGETVRVEAPGGATLVSADGLSTAPGGLVLVQNQPALGNRTIFAGLDGTGRRATEVRVLAGGVPEGLVPFTSAVGDGWVYLVASPPSELLGTDEPYPAPAVVRAALDRPGP